MSKNIKEGLVEKKKEGKYDTWIGRFVKTAGRFI
jgi:hypothetical protein